MTFQFEWHSNLIMPSLKLVYLSSKVKKKVTLFCIISILVLLTHIPNGLFGHNINAALVFLSLAPLGPTWNRKTHKHSAKRLIYYIYSGRSWLCSTYWQTRCSQDCSTNTFIINWLTNLLILFLQIFRPPSRSNRKSKGPEIFRECLPPTNCRMSRVNSHVSHFTCHK